MGTGFGFSGGGGGSSSGGGGASIAQIKAALVGASDADKFAVTAALHATPEVLYTEAAASVKSRDRWLNIQLTRELTNADATRLMVIRFWNARRQAEAEMSVRRFLALTPMDASGDTFAQRAEALQFIAGDRRTDRTFKNAGTATRATVPLFVGRPTENPQTARRIILGSNSFGNSDEQWGSVRIQIELRSLI